jgi:hypothetical protein
MERTESNAGQPDQTPIETDPAYDYAQEEVLEDWDEEDDVLDEEERVVPVEEERVVPDEDRVVPLDEEEKRGA